MPEPTPVNQVPRIDAALLDLSDRLVNELTGKRPPVGEPAVIPASVVRSGSFAAIPRPVVGSRSIDWEDVLERLLLRGVRPGFRRAAARWLRDTVLRRMAGGGRDERLRGRRP